MDFNICENVNQFQENIPPLVNRGGRPTVDYKNRYLSLERRCIRSGLQVDSKVAFQQQMKNSIDDTNQELQKRIADLENQLKKANDRLKKKVKKRKQSGKLRKNMNAKHFAQMKPYTEKCVSQQREMRCNIYDNATANSAHPSKDKAALIRDLVRYSKCEKEAIEMIFEDSRIANVIQDEFANKAVFYASTNELNRAREFVGRKRQFMSRKKRSSVTFPKGA